MPKKKVRTYQVSFSYTCTKYFTVKAVSKGEAEAQAEQLNMDGKDPTDYHESSECLSDCVEVEL